MSASPPTPVRSKQYDYSERYTIIDGHVKKLVWMPVYERTFTSDYPWNEYEESSIDILNSWRKTPESQWIVEHMAEDLRVEKLEIMEYDSFGQQLRLIVMARFYEEMATLYVLTWK
jgi:hypothetical protein